MLPAPPTEREHDPAQPDPWPSPAPAARVDGLAVYDTGLGGPVLLMPCPHGFASAPAAASPLAILCLALGRRVITFDPPGAFRSPRAPRCDMGEMLDCAETALTALEIEGPVDTIGHSMAALCALGFAVERPHRVGRLVLVGGAAGYPSIRRWGMPRNWHWWQPAFWRFARLGARLRSGRGSLADHKRLWQLTSRASFRDPANAPSVTVEPADHLLPPPARDRWLGSISSVDYRPHVARVAAPTLVCAGRHDPQTPLGCSDELARNIPDATLITFDSSGHSPFIEEPEAFASILDTFLRAEPFGSAVG